MSTQRVARKSTAKERDGLGSSVEPLKDETLPPRTHAIHVILYRAFLDNAWLDRRAIEQQLQDWGYTARRVAVTQEHLHSLLNGWGKRKIKAVERDSEYRYRLTAEAKRLLENAPRHSFK
jgi:hypothetical protein